MHNTSCKRQVLQVLQYASNPTERDYNKSLKRQMQQVPAKGITANPAGGNKSWRSSRSHNIHCNKPCDAHRTLQYSTASKGVQCNKNFQRSSNKSCSFLLQQNPGAVWELVLWRWPSQIVTFPCPDQSHPLKSKATLHGLTGCSSHGSSPVQETTGDGPRSINPDL